MKNRKSRFLMDHRLIWQPYPQLALWCSTLYLTTDFSILPHPPSGLGLLTFYKNSTEIVFYVCTVRGQFTYRHVCNVLALITHIMYVLYSCRSLMHGHTSQRRRLKLGMLPLPMGVKIIEGSIFQSYDTSHNLLADFRPFKAATSIRPPRLFEAVRGFNKPHQWQTRRPSVVLISILKIYSIVFGCHYVFSYLITNTVDHSDCIGLIDQQSNSIQYIRHRNNFLFLFFLLIIESYFVGNQRYEKKTK